MDYLNHRVMPIVLGLILSVGLVGLPPKTSAQTPEGAILSGELDRAKNLLDTVKNRDEALFLRGLITFRKQQYGQARKQFESLIEQFPDSPRAEDASYYLDRLKLYSPEQTDPPRVNVQLAEGKQLSGTISGPVAVRRKNGETLTVVRSDQSWSVQKGYVSSAGLTIVGQTYSMDENSSITLQPLRDDGQLSHDNNPYRGAFKIEYSNQQFNLVNNLPLNHYLYGVVRKEIAPNWPVETIKAQSVAARSFALSKIDGGTGAFDLKSSHLAQVYGGRDAETERVRKAVEATRGEVLTHSNRVVPAYFHANSGGYIETASAVWGNHSNTPYIISKPDTWSKTAQHNSWETSLSVRRLRNALTESNYTKPASNPSLRVESRLTSGRSKTISYRTGYSSRETLPANDFRMAVGPNKLKSSWIDSIRNSGRTIVFEGRGWGHGIGMSQWGAHSMGEAGVPYRRILSFYYERAKLMGQYGLGTSREGEINE